MMELSVEEKIALSNARIVKSKEMLSDALTALSLHFIKTKLLSSEMIKIFKNLLSLRTDVDYGDFETIELLKKVMPENH